MKRLSIWTNGGFRALHGRDATSVPPEWDDYWERITARIRYPIEIETTLSGLPVNFRGVRFEENR